MIRIALPSKWHIFDDIEALLANWFSFAFRLFEIETRSTEKLFVVLRQRSAWFSPAIGINTVTLETFEAPFSIQSAGTDLKGANQINIKGSKFVRGCRIVGQPVYAELTCEQSNLKFKF